MLHIPELLVLPDVPVSKGSPDVKMLLLPPAPDLLGPCEPDPGSVCADVAVAAIARRLVRSLAWLRGTPCASSTMQQSVVQVKACAATLQGDANRAATAHNARIAVQKIQLLYLGHARCTMQTVQ